MDIITQKPVYCRDCKYFSLDEKVHPIMGTCSEGVINNPYKNDPRMCKKFEVKPLTVITHFKDPNDEEINELRRMLEK